MSFTCSVCGEAHAGETRDIRMGLPDAILRIDEEERDNRAWVGADSAVLRDGESERFFVRALLELPVAEESGYFGYGTWVEVDAAGFDALGELWHDEDGWRNGPFAGSLANELHPYAFTEGLPVRLRLREVRLLPLAELDDSDHELVRAQRNGISSHRAHELATTVG